MKLEREFSTKRAESTGPFKVGELYNLSISSCYTCNQWHVSTTFLSHGAGETTRQSTKYSKLCVPPAKTAYCFIENSYEGEKIELRQDDGIETSMQATESLPINDPFMKQIFTKDIEAQKDSAALLLVFPAGLAAHMEAGISYGLGRPCYAIYQPEKTETLYNIFEEVFPDLSSLEGWLKLQESSHLSKEHDETRQPLSNV